MSTPPSPPRQPQLAKLNPTIYQVVRVCPECSGPVIRNSGCVTCASCGWGRCG